MENKRKKVAYVTFFKSFRSDIIWFWFISCSG